MDMNRIIGALFSGFACRLYAAGFAVYLAWNVARFLLDVAHKVTLAF